MKFTLKKTVLAAVFLLTGLAGLTSCSREDSFSVNEPGPAIVAKADKVTICHVTDEGYNLISVSGNAQEAHLKHGDHLAPEGATKAIECNLYTITASAGANGSISPAGEVTVNHGTNQTFEFTPDAGYKVSAVTVDGMPVPVASSYTFTGVLEDHTINVDFTVSNLTLHAIEDAFLRANARNTNEGGNLRIRISGGTGDNSALVKFDLSGVSLVGLQQARLRLTATDTENWVVGGGDNVRVHRILTAWTEGNGKNDLLPGTGSSYRGNGVGVTWNSPTDLDISNNQIDGPTWSFAGGGDIAPTTASAVWHYPGISGPVEWDVTQDVLSGIPHGFLIRRQAHQAGVVWYYSREGATDAGDPSLAPQLILVYGNGN